MRPLAVAAFLSLLPAVAAAGEPDRILLEVGEQRPLVGFRPLCDDPAIARIVAGEKGHVEGLKEGETTCSLSVGSPLGQRIVYRIVVTPRAPKGKGTGKGAPEG